MYVTDKVVLTEDEDKITHYCEDFCPIYYKIKEYNRNHEYNILCPNEMCDRITSAYIMNRRKYISNKQNT